MRWCSPTKVQTDGVTFFAGIISLTMQRVVIAESILGMVESDTKCSMFKWRSSTRIRTRRIFVVTYRAGICTKCLLLELHNYTSTQWVSGKNIQSNLGVLLAGGMLELLRIIRSVFGSSASGTSYSKS